MKGHVDITIDWKQTIGILGGLGPMAHIEFEKRLLTEARRFARRDLVDQEYPPWIVASIPQIPERSGPAERGTKEPVLAMVASLSRLSAADFITIPCNTAHAFLPDLRAMTQTPILDMIELTASAVAAQYGRQARVGLLASSGTLRSRVYHRAANRVAPGLVLLDPLGCQADGPDVQARVSACIFGRGGSDDDLKGGIKGGAHELVGMAERFRYELHVAASRLADEGADVVVLGCTEFPLVVDGTRLGGLPFVDPLTVLARQAIVLAASPAGSTVEHAA